MVHHDIGTRANKDAVLLALTVQPWFVVVDKDRSCNMHRVDEAKSLLNAALAQTVFYRIGDVDKPSPRRHLKPELFSVAFHLDPSSVSVANI